MQDGGDGSPPSAEVDGGVVPRAERRPRTPSARHASPNPDALIAAGAELFAASGPGAVAIRTVAEAAGCSHALVGRHFGSKTGLEHAVAARLGAQLAELRRSVFDDGCSLATVVTRLRTDPVTARLLVRCGLGELEPDPLLGEHGFALRLAETIERFRSGEGASPSPTAKVGAYVVLSTMFGYLTYEDFVVNACRLIEVPVEARDAATAAACELLLGAASDPGNDLSWPPAPRRNPVARDVDRDHGTRSDRLLRAAVGLYVERGPAAVSTRDIARRAGVNQGLIYHYFGSRETLIAQAIETANRDVVAAATATGAFDLATFIRAQPDLRSVVIIARYLVDGGRILDVRPRFPIVDGILARYPSVPTGAGPGTLADPRLAVMAATACFNATAAWDGILRRALDIPATADLTASLIRATELLLSQAD